MLLLPLPALLVWTACGAAGFSPPNIDETGGLKAAAPQGRRRWIALLVIALSLLGMLRSTALLITMEIVTSRSDRASLAALIDPGNYRLRLRLARGGKRAQRCRHALAARALYPEAHDARAVARGCRN